MLKKLILKHIQGLLNWLIVLTLIGTVLLAMQNLALEKSAQSNIAKQEIETIQQSILDTFYANETFLNRFVLQADSAASIRDLPASIAGLALQYADGHISQMSGASLSSLMLDQNIVNQLSTGRTAMLAVQTSITTDLYMLHALPNGQAVAVAKINIGRLIQTKQQQHVDLRMDKNTLFFIHATNNLQPSVSRQIVNQLTRAKQGYQALHFKSADYHSYASHVDMMKRYANSSWVFVTVKPSGSLLVTLIQPNQHSMYLFACLLLIFSFVYLKFKLGNTIQDAKLKGVTTNLYKNVAAHLQAISNLNNAILSGVKFDEIKKHGVMAIMEIMPTQTSGIAMFESNKHDGSEILVANAQKQMSYYKANIDQVFRNEIARNPNGFLITKQSSHQFSIQNIDLNKEDVLVGPVHKEGNVQGFIFCALKHGYRPTDLQAKYFQNIAQHLGVALTTIQQGEKLYIREYFDPVTEFYNQHACRERLSQEMSNARRRKAKLAILHMQLVGYKSVTDTYGMATGDELIKLIARRLRENLRETDIVARIENDELLIVTSDIEKLTNANRLADKLSQLISEPTQIFDNVFHLSTAIGISIYPEDGLIVDEVLNHASIALNRAKKQGKGAYAFYEENLGTDEKWRIQLEKSLRDALSKNELVMFYQPQFNPRTKRLSGMEALIRWNHPEKGMISPSEFIQLAEDSGLIVQLGHYVRKLSFAQFVKWQKMGIAPSTVSVNVSTYELQRQEFLGDVQKVITETGIDPKHVELEITETVMVDVTGNVTENLNKLHEMGIRIAIDDFGTGYSNLSYLGRLTFDVLKIDKSFMYGVGVQANANRIVTMMIDMAHHLGKAVCAEGIENDVQYQFLEQAGCDIFQGFFISKPVSAEEYEKLVSPQQEVVTA